MKEDSLYYYHLVEYVENVNSLNFGFKGRDEFYQHKWEATQGLLRFGGSFSGALGEMLAHADHANTNKIYKTWRKELDEHRKLFLKWKKENNEEA